MYAGSLLVRPGSPASFLNRELAEILPATAVQEERQIFQGYGAEGDSVWAANWTRSLDLSGVAWDSSRAGTLIHPRYVVFATHFQRRVGEELVFHDRDGRRVSRRLVSKRVILGARGAQRPDVTVGQLDRPVPEGVAHYPLLPAGHDYRRVLQGAPLLVTDQRRRVHVFRVNRVVQGVVEEVTARPALGEELGVGWDTRLQRGDSGHPAFIWFQGRLVLVSILRGGGWASRGGFLGGERLQGALMEAIMEMEIESGADTAGAS